MKVGWYDRYKKNLRKRRFWELRDCQCGLKLLIGGSRPTQQSIIEYCESPPKILRQCHVVCPKCDRRYAFAGQAALMDVT